MSKLILVMGLPGSGKTMHANSLKGVKLHIDEIRKSLTGSYIPGENDELVYKTVQTSVEYYLKNGKTVVVDGAMLSKKARSHYVNLAKKHFSYVELFWLDASRELLEIRLEERNKTAEKDRKIQPDYILKVGKHLEIPTRDEGIDAIHWLCDQDLIAMEG